jgi:4-hydroxybenzoate polyprenyltransferase
MIKGLKQVDISRTYPFISLTRLNRPIGALLLLWPTIWALWIASEGWPGFHIFLVFSFGTVMARSAGCVINDLVDRNFDPHVERTKSRPLGTLEISAKSATILVGVLLSGCFLLVITLNIETILLSLGAIVIMSIYPFMKRYTHLPQVFLGIAFSWGIPMAFTAIGSDLNNTVVMLVIANILWVIAYDTQYAMVDKEDDILLGLKSTAILFGKYARLITSALQVLCLTTLIILGTSNDFGSFYYLAISGAGMLFCYQQLLLSRENRDDYFKAFLNNNWVGMIIFFGVAANFL